MAKLIHNYESPDSVVAVKSLEALNRNWKVLDARVGDYDSLLHSGLRRELDSPKVMKPPDSAIVKTAYQRPEYTRKLSGGSHSQLWITDFETSVLDTEWQDWIESMTASRKRRLSALEMPKRIAQRGIEADYLVRTILRPEPNEIVSWLEKQDFNLKLEKYSDGSAEVFPWKGHTFALICAQDVQERKLEDSDVSTEVGRLFSLATFIDLEPGMSNSFSDGIERIVEQQGSRALDAIMRIVLDEETASSIALEALKYVGNIDSPRWHEERRLMLEECLLKSRSAWVKDGAGLGLSFLDNPRSIPAIERAITIESSRALKEDLKLVLNQLKRTLGA